jgi:hypothetical protein
MPTNPTLLLLTLITLTLSDNILLILDNKNIQTTHQNFITTLQQSHHLTITYSYLKNKI